MDHYPHPAAYDDQRLIAESEIRKARRSGPGGQHRNKVETAVIIHHRPTGVTAEANERRTARDNRRVALFRLRLKLAVEFRETVDQESKPSPLWISRCRNKKIAVNSSHVDFPALLAEVLDMISFSNHDMTKTADYFECSSSQLVKLIQKEPQAFAQLNRERIALGLHSLR